MIQLQVLVTIACIITASADGASKSERCDLLKKEQLEAKLDKLFRQLPERYVSTNSLGHFRPIGLLFLGNTAVYGFDSLRSDRPYQTFCRGEDTVTVFTLRTTHSPLTVVVPWLLCSGNDGTLQSEATPVRYEGELITRKSSNGTLSFKIENVLTLQLQNVYLRMTGGGSTLRTAFAILGLLFPVLATRFWNADVTEILKMALTDGLKATE